MTYTNMTAVYFTGQAVDLYQQTFEVQSAFDGSKPPKCNVPSKFVALAGFRVASFSKLRSLMPFSFAADTRLCIYGF